MSRLRLQLYRMHPVGLILLRAQLTRKGERRNATGRPSHVATGKYTGPGLLAETSRKRGVPEKCRIERVLPTKEL
jgi:hypothetical protein